MTIVGEKNTEMLQEVLKFPNLLVKGLKKGKKFSLPREYKKERIKHIGMGASALVGSYLETYLPRKLQKLTMEVIRTPQLSFSPETLYIIYSYSGQTIETIEVLKKLVSKKDAKIVVATSGGKLENIAQKRDLPYVELPEGFESRSHLPFGVSVLAYLLGEAFEINTEVESDLEGAIEAIKSEKKEVLSEKIEDLEQITKGLEASFPVAVGDPALSPVLLRFVNQLAENAKHLASSTILPEGAHNLICPLRRSRVPVSLFFLKRTSLNAFTSKLTKEFKRVLRERKTFEITTDDKKFSMKTLLHPTFLVDLISVMIADEKDLSSYDIQEIEEVKEKTEKYLT